MHDYAYGQTAGANDLAQQSAAPPATTVGTEIDRALAQASECNRLALEIANRVLGPAPAGKEAVQPMPPHIRGQIANVSTVNGHTASMLQSVLEAL